MEGVREDDPSTDSILAQSGPETQEGSDGRERHFILHHSLVTVTPQGDHLAEIPAILTNTEGNKEDDPSIPEEKSWAQETFDNPYWRRPTTYLDEDMNGHFTEETKREALIEKPCRRRDIRGISHSETSEKSVIARHQKGHK
jgi:hypothetical protein